MDNTVNIMTFCDNGYVKYVFPQIASIAENLKQYKVNFYLFHSRIEPQNIELLKNYCKNLENVAFNEVVVRDFLLYESLYPGQTGWTYEMYYSLCCHKYLPETVDRILYIDIDVYISGDISDYYFCDFENKNLLVTLVKAKSRGSLYSENDLENDEDLKIIARGLFNSGSYMINVEKLRKENITMENYLKIAEVLIQRLKTPNPWFGDQGLLSVAFTGSIKYYMYPQVQDIAFMPYNFCLWFFDRAKELDLWYEPKIIHFAGADFKPWQVKFGSDFKWNFEKDFSGERAPCSLKKKQIAFFEAWWKYCSQTPVYEELSIPAIAYAKALEKHFFPLCERYNKFADKYIELAKLALPLLQKANQKFQI
ncbi:MAG: hypothetical protein LBQ87_01720 [Candidatus Fibromonas sp.]|nr:hypothetical protein [Candidatus Fibromonas sp.]